MGAKFAKNAYLHFMLWGVCSALGITVSTIVDAVLVGNFIGSAGLAVANIATPVFLVYSLLGLTVGVGANILIGEKLGAAEIAEANRIFNGQILFGVVLGTVCLTLAVSFQDRLCRFLGADGELLLLARQYLTVTFYAAPVFVLYHILSISVRTDGDPKLAAAASTTVIFTNLSLDIFFMKFLNWGILGASLSLCIAEVMGTIVLLFHFAKKHTLLRFYPSIPQLTDVQNFVRNGFGVGSAFIFQAVVILAFNTLLLSGGNDGVAFVAIFGVIYTVSTIPFAVFDGAGSAVSTVVSIFSGEKDGKSMLTVLRQGIRIVSATGLLITLAIWLWAEWIVRFFGISDPGALAAVPALRVFSISIWFTGINTLVTAFWQAIGRSRLAGAMSVMRNLILMLALGAVLISRFQIIGLAATYFCAEALCLLGILLVLLFARSETYIAKKYQAPNRVYEQYYTIHSQSVAKISDDLTRLCCEWSIDPKKAFFINLIVEELLLNIIKYGLKDTGKKHYIAIKLLDRGGEYIIRIRDNVNTYDPFSGSGDSIDAAVLKLIRNKTKVCNYQRKLIFNYLYLII